MKDKIILHLDMDSFYASVEIRDNPLLSNRPVIIGADPMKGNGRGVVSTCSYEARRYGVHSAMPISHAYRLCPHACFLPPLMSKYQDVSRSIINHLTKITENIEQVSIDEVYLDISSCESYQKAEEFAFFIKQLIIREERLTCSIGLAPSKTYAKIASEQNKPDGLTVISPDQLISFLHPLPAESIPGIGKRSLMLLHTHGLFLIGDLAKTDIQELQDIFRSNAVRIQMIAQGKDREGLSYRGLKRSIGRDYTFPTDTSDSDLIYQHLFIMVSQISSELEKSHMLANIITLRLRYSGFVTKTKSVSREHPTRDNKILYNLILHLFDEIWTGETLRLIGVRCSGLFIMDSCQKTLLDF